MITVKILVHKTGNPRQPSSATIDVISGGRTQRFVLSAQRDFHLQMGDSIKCILGAAVALINPGTQAGAYILTANLPPVNDGKYLTVLHLNAETTRNIPRGSISVKDDIGTILRSTAAATR